MRNQHRSELPAFKFVLHFPFHISASHCPKLSLKIILVLVPHSWRFETQANFLAFEALMAQQVKNLPAMQAMIPGSKSSLQEEMATYSSILAWKIPWREEPCWLQSRSHRESDTIDWLHISTGKKSRPCDSYQKKLCDLVASKSRTIWNLGFVHMKSIARTLYSELNIDIYHIVGWMCNRGNLTPCWICSLSSILSALLPVLSCKFSTFSSRMFPMVWNIQTSQFSSLWPLMV